MSLVSAGSVTISSGKEAYSVRGCFPIAYNKFVVVWENTTDLRTEATVCTVDNTTDAITVEGTTTIFSDRPGYFFKPYYLNGDFYMYSISESSLGGGGVMTGVIIKYSNPGWSVGSNQLLSSTFGGSVQGAGFLSVHPVSGQIMYSIRTLGGLTVGFITPNWITKTMVERVKPAYIETGNFVSSYRGGVLMSPTLLILPGTAGVPNAATSANAVGIVRFGADPVGVALNSVIGGEQVYVKTAGMVEMASPLSLTTKYSSGLMGDALASDEDPFFVKPIGVSLNDRKSLKLLI
jgi:hypothetical protein